MVPDVFATTRLSQMISIINLICYAEELPDSSMCSFAYYNLSLSLSLSLALKIIYKENYINYIRLRLAIADQIPVRSQEH